MYGASTDNNATLFAQGYNATLRLRDTPWPPARSTRPVPRRACRSSQEPGRRRLRDRVPAGLLGHPGDQRPSLAYDENAAPIISYLQSQGVRQTRSSQWSRRHPHGLPEHHLWVPVRDGLQAGLVGGTSCRRVGIYLRADVKPPKGLRQQPLRLTWMPRPLH